MQLRRIVADIRQVDPVAYDFTYTDTDGLGEEIDEWFVYMMWQWIRLNGIQKTFEWQWQEENGGGPRAADVRWEDVSERKRTGFVRAAVEALAAAGDADDDVSDRLTHIGKIAYVVLGRWGIQPDDTQTPGHTELQMAQEELLNLMTIMYMAMQLAISRSGELQETRKQLRALSPSLPNFMLLATSRLRWDDAGFLPQPQMFLLLWKSLLLIFGGTEELVAAKRETRETPEDGKEKDIITASPLTTTLSVKSPEQWGLHPPPTRTYRNACAIPTALARGGRQGRQKAKLPDEPKLPFLYPPLDSTSNTAGGKDPAGIQSLLLHRKWEGSDIPASILEAGDIFSRRVRMTRAARQLWDEREAFIKFDRGWEPDQEDDDDDDDDDDIEELFLDELSEEERKEIEALRKGYREKPPPPDRLVDLGPKKNVSKEVERQLNAVEDFYRESLPNLQSLVIVLLKAILVNITAVIVQGPANQQHPGMANRGPNGHINGVGQAQGPGSNGSPAPALSIEDIDAARTREITAKAATGILLLTLKWFKVSHVLKFEYLTQLLLDSNYIPLVLKLLHIRISNKLWIVRQTGLSIASSDSVIYARG
ncbi:unnamed protein product [Parascedosporium putredinis]|uniref:Far11/STRP N-terminal domain-containing protein n=1 Tax=Parascedosporium putredinis TaxID=1442378 RepID=A0A9P1GU10_9PEZI|nr:unnamed protein product [Parascedosporium putredinis]CAI7987318.1 unnamed protein product [Parascedosporium putredinis]